MTPAEIAALEALAFDTLLDFRGRDALRALLTDYQALQAQVAGLREALASHATDTWAEIVNDMPFHGVAVPPSGPYILIRDLMAWRPKALTPPPTETT